MHMNCLPNGIMNRGFNFHKMFSDTLSFFFFLHDILGPHLEGMPGPLSGQTQIVRFFGITMQGNSVLCHIHGFVPYFYVAAPKDFKPEDCNKFRECLDKAIINDMKSNKDQINKVYLYITY